MKRRRSRSTQSNEDVLADFAFDRIYGGDSIRAVCEQVRLVAKTSLGVAIVGEPGTGKSHFARCLHDRSDRAKSPLVYVSPRSRTEQEFEEDLFGAIRDLRTRRCYPQKAKVASAARSTLLIDCIGELSISAQLKLLRLIEFGKYSKLGGSEVSLAAPRIIGTSVVPVETLLASGQLIPQLALSMATIRIQLPALREIPDEIPILAESLLRTQRGPSWTFSNAAIVQLQSRGWPDNVRELKAVVLAANTKCNEDAVVDLGDLPTT